MKLPRLMVITERSLMRPSFEEALQAAVRGRARLIQLRTKSADAEEVLLQAQAAQKLCEYVGARLLINSHRELIDRIGAAGLHLPEKDSVARARQALGHEYSVGQSVHSVASAQQAEEQGADYVIFGSVFPTGSHRESTPAGLDALKKVSASVAIPVYAIGGINSSNAGACLENHAHGVAVIRAVWDAPDVEQAVGNLIRALGE